MRGSQVVISFLVAAIATYCAYLFTPNFVHLVDLALDKLFNVRFGYWSLQNIVFALTVGTIPLISLIPWIIRGHTDVSSLLAFNFITSFLITLFISGMVFMIVLFSPRGVFNTIEQPHVDFWKYVFVGSNILAVLILSIFSIFTKEKFRSKTRYRTSKAELDQ